MKMFESQAHVARGGGNRGAILRRVTGVAVATMMVGGLATACSSADSSDGGDGSKLAVLSYNSAIPFNAEFNEAFQSAAEQLGDDATALDGKGDPQVQFAAVNQVLNQGYDGFMINTVEGVNARQIQAQAAASETPYVSIYITTPWYTPWEAGDQFVSYLQPDIAQTSEDLVGVLADHFGSAGAGFVRIGGVKGGTSDELMTSGTQAGLAAHSNLTELGSDNSDYTVEGGQKRAAALLSRFPDAKAIVTGTSVDAEGAIAAIRALGKVPGQDIVVVAGDAGGTAAKHIVDGQILAAAAAPSSVLAYASAARLHDVRNGWTPDPAERMLWVKQPIITNEDAAVYVERFIDGPLDRQFDARKLSHVEAGDDWDPQADYYPIRDLSELWPLSAPPADWTEPAEFVDGRDNGGFDRIESQYADAYRTPLVGPSPVDN